MTDKSEWKEANRQLQAEARRELGEPPTAEEMLAYSRGELSESEEERIQDLLVAYPELARMYGAPFSDGTSEGEDEAVSEDEVRAGWSDLQRRLGRSPRPAGSRVEAQRGRLVVRRYAPTAIAAALAIVCFGLFAQAEKKARHYERAANVPRVLGAPQELEPDGNRGPSAPTILQNDGDVYLLKLRIINQVRYPHYWIELTDQNGTVAWEDNSVQPDEDDVVQITVPHGFLRAGTTYRLRIFGVDGKSRTPAGTYDVAAPAES